VSYSVARIGFILTILIPIGLGITIWWKQNSLNSDERLLFARLGEAMLHQPPQATEVIAAFGLPDNCRDQTCSLKQGQIGNLHYTGGDLRQPEHGIVFILKGFYNACIRSERVRTYFHTGEAEQPCLHGGCWYTRAQHDWGILTFELESRTSECVRSVVINSLPERRPRP
jgi:hypothetical protein